jgi:mannose-6-phosphate isomerase-like protein (cupin superfamily)
MIFPQAQQLSLSQDEMEARVVRYADLRPCFNAFIDTRSPGSDAKENFTIIGPGVSENPEQYVHIAEPHGFNIGGARQPPHCVNSQHSHDTAEVFIVHTGQWRFDLGEHGDDAQVFIGPGDVISIPTQTFRGFTNVGETSGFLFAILGRDDPGKVLWAPDVFEIAKTHGLVLLETGQLIDTIAGQTVPAGAKPMPVTSSDQIARLNRVTQDEAETYVWRSKQPSGTYATAIIDPSGPLDLPHGFSLARLDIEAGSDIAVMRSATAEVVFVHSGDLAVAWGTERIVLHPGDTMTVPIGLDRTFSSRGGCSVFAVHGD